MLILGSMPGVASLEANEYYAHPQNSFWRIMGDIAGARPELGYAARTRRLVTRRIAVWDVLQTCVRRGSGDAEIVEDTIVPNDFGAFFAAHPKIRQVYFNGSKAELVFRRRVLPSLHVELDYGRLPSTSPKHASRTYRQKLAAWRAALDSAIVELAGQ